MSEHGLTLRFKVIIDGYGNLGNWGKCEGLAVEYSVHEYKEGGQNGFAHKLPGRASYQNLKLTRPVDSDSTLVAGWLASIQGMVQRQTAQIAILDAEGAVVTAWNLMDVFPVKWSGPTLDVGSNAVAMETLELAHNGFLGPR
jgi:phage tail-like protein